MRHRAHGVKQRGQAPAQLFAAAGKHHVLHAPGNLLGGRAHAVRRGAARGGDAVVDALDAEGRGQVGRNGGTHAARDLIRPHAADALAAQDVGRLNLVGGRAAARTHDEARARVRNLRGRQPRLCDGVLQRDVGIGGGIAHEAAQFAVDARVQVNARLPGHLAAQAHFGKQGHGADAAAPFAQRSRHAGLVVAYARDDARARDDDPLPGAHVSYPCSAA